uniref:Uncharacterized protein n=1 Tax=Rangifer tarandus platyrhynchus TaxID=3082113 RepID=A0ACB0DYD4_RANTA|nr:unnamed protein product [Rangifer tarandus platyrhynchus]
MSNPVLHTLGAGPGPRFRHMRCPIHYTVDAVSASDPFFSVKAGQRQDVQACGVPLNRYVHGSVQAVEDHYQGTNSLIMV